MTTLTVPRRSNMGRYGLWQMRDYFMDRGFLTLILVAALGYAQAFQMTQMRDYRLGTLAPREIAQYGTREAAKAAISREMVSGFVARFAGTVVFLSVLIAMHGFAANDRKMGYYRFLFAKPVAPVRYYGQAFGLHIIGFAFVFTALALFFGALVAPVLTVPLFTVAVLMFFFYASIAFVFSAATPVDWLPLIAITVASDLLWTRYESSPSVFAKALYILPPLHKTAQVYSAAATGSALPWSTLGWFAGYGAVCLCAALVVLHRRRLAVS